MAEWERSLLQTIEHCLRNSPEPLQAIATGQMHLAVLVEPYLSLIMNGRKTVQSRFCRRKWVPYEMVNPGDTLILKRSSGPVVGLCKVGEVFYYDLSRVPLAAIRKQFGSAIAATENSFWEYQKQAQFVSLFSITKVIGLPNIECHKGKGDRRAWVVLQEAIAKSPMGTPVKEAREMIRQQFAVDPGAAITNN